MSLPIVLALYIAIFLIPHPAISAEPSMVLELIPLHYRSAEEILPTIQPMVVAPGRIAGTNDQLILRAPPDAIAEIRSLIKELDQPPRRFLISVHSGHDSPGSRYSPNVLHSYSTEENTQQLQILEGESGFIRAGHSVPVLDHSITYWGHSVRRHEGIAYRDVTQGFFVTPRWSNGEVILEIHAQSDRLNAIGNGAVDLFSTTTTLRGPTGKWLPVGSTAEQYIEKKSHRGYRWQTQGHEVSQLWIKVELLP